MPQPGTRLAAISILAAAQFITTSWLFAFGEGLERWQNPVFLLRFVLLSGLVAIPVFALLIWQSRHDLLATWHRHDWPARLQPALAVNLGLFALLVPATVLLTKAGAEADVTPWHLFWPYSGLLLATGASLAILYAPLTFWTDLLRSYPLAALSALLAALTVQLASVEAQQGWNGLAHATLTVSYVLLSAMDPSAFITESERTIGTGRFYVEIDPSCSGYEGIALVLMFLSLYLFVFRSTLRFPAALLLLPIGVAAIWLLNAVRIALLVLIGAYINPDIALKGFHSQAGWLSFLLVSIAMMMAAHRIPLFNREAAPAKTSPADRDAQAMLAPFVALMAGHILVTAAAPHGEWLIAAKLAFAAGAIWLMRDVYRSLDLQVSAVAIAAGVVVGAAWVATNPATKPNEVMDAFLASQPAGLAAVWLILRASLGVIIVPIAEELAFRGFLYRLISERGPASFAAPAFSIAAIVVSSLLFGLLHERWLAGTLAGVVFALVMVRSGRLSDAIAAHVAANAVVVGWAIATRQWSLI